MQKMTKQAGKKNTSERRERCEIWRKNVRGGEQTGSMDERERENHKKTWSTLRFQFLLSCISSAEK